jgi:hypothetical protein
MSLGIVSGTASTISEQRLSGLPEAVGYVKPSWGEHAMQRRRVRHTVSFEERLAEEAKRL